MTIHRVSGAVVLVCFLATAALGQASRPRSQPAEAGKAAAPDSVAVTVNEHKIMESDVDAMFKVMVADRMQGQKMPASYVDGMRKRYRPNLVEMLIDNWLLDQAAEKAAVKLTDQEVVAEAERGLQAYLLHSGMTREELDERMQSGGSTSLKSQLDRQAADPAFRASVLHAKLMAKKYPDEVKVTDEEIKAEYEKNLELVYKKPEQVKASHILIGTKDAKTEEEKAEAKKKIDAILVEAKKPGADFAELARKHSTCSSKSRGGDLGFFPRKDAMEEPFAAAAFALKVGEISDIVETRFGYHIIKVTDKKAPTTITLAQARDSILQQLSRSKTDTAKKRYLAELKETAKIVYPPGKEPTATSMPTRTTTTRPTREPLRRPAPGTESTQPAAKTNTPVTKTPAMKTPAKAK